MCLSFDTSPFFKKHKFTLLLIIFTATNLFYRT